MVWYYSLAGLFPDKCNSDKIILRVLTGSQFTSIGWVSSLLARNIRISMDGKGRCFDNIYLERFWQTIKYEKVYLKSYETVPDVKLALMNFSVFIIMSVLIKSGIIRHQVTCI